MNKRGPSVNHLAFADDIILFCSGCRKSLTMMMDILSTYEKNSGQLVNKHKSCVSLAPNQQAQEIERIEEITGKNHKDFPIKYLGCPLYIGKKNAAVFSNMISKVLSKIGGWQSKLLSIGERAVLIKHVLLALYVHLLAVIHPPVSVLNQIERMLNRFFWGGTNEVKKYHWASWENLGIPYEEGGADFRRIQDICKAFTTKQWWNLRAKYFLWSELVLAKYCQRIHPVRKKWYSGHSHSWNAMCKIKEDMDQRILWKVGRGEVSLWYDNWTKLGALWKFLPEDRKPSNIKLCDVLYGGL